MVVARSYSLDQPRRVDGLRLLRRDGLTGYRRLDFNLHRRDSGKGRTTSKTESCVVGVRFTTCLA